MDCQKSFQGYKCSKPYMLKKGDSWTKKSKVEGRTLKEVWKLLCITPCQNLYRLFEYPLALWSKSICLVYFDKEFWARKIKWMIKNLMVIKNVDPLSRNVKRRWVLKSTKRSTCKQGQNYTFVKLYQKTHELELGS